ncbi:DUF362 domain-containing protein [Desulfomonile tiedjei]|uniref:Uncharacterized Fe-S center protein n=1 Tax=Desulfomonile tiedjei (strain ATCC 49306 / DSM 6799 / DCB-1) TaxID=706587 RepID=I4C520_DESTA|nr:DUF362 domain-containing protein [Desulfomonile tiedjei]AFM24661.1 uncharacterized Fe-S center protein [Desulfomonile tiedjei DSM 6799]
MERRISRRSFLKKSAIALSTVALCDSRGIGSAVAAPQNKSQVFFTKDISVNGLLKIYAKVNQGMTGKIGIKLHSGEPHGPNLLPIELIKGLQPHIPNSTIVESNVLYPSPRRTTKGHLETIKTNGFDFCPVDIMDADGDVMLPIPGMREFFDKWLDPSLTQRPFIPGVHLTDIAVGKSLMNYDSLLVYTHFKGHTSGGFGGSLKNIAIGCASGQVGKRQVHGEGWSKGPLFLERMVEAGKGITGHFDPHITYINVLKNISVDCDCNAHGAKPTCDDIGIVGSTDILAIDKASVDLVYALPPDQRRDIVERIESRSGLHQLEYMKTLNMGNDRYELITL